MPAAKTDVKAEAIARMALKSFATRRADRGSVEDGKSYPGVALKVSGSVGKKQVSFNIIGKLSVGESNPSGSTKRPTAELVLASLITHYLPKTRLQKLLDDVSKNRQLELPDTAAVESAKAIVQALSKTSARAGSVSFIEE
jgi:hypothetical protein